jgi:hypothetical protein
MRKLVIFVVAFVFGTGAICQAKVIQEHVLTHRVLIDENGKVVKKETHQHLKSDKSVHPDTHALAAMKAAQTDPDVSTMFSLSGMFGGAWEWTKHAAHSAAGGISSAWHATTGWVGGLFGGDKKAAAKTADSGDAATLGFFGNMIDKVKGFFGAGSSKSDKHTHESTEEVPQQ